MVLNKTLIALAMGMAIKHAEKKEMTTQPPAQDVGDTAIAAAFREVIGPNGGLIQNDHIVDYVLTRARELQQALPRNEWKDAVLNELIVAHVYQKEHETNPRKAIQDAITWNCQVALDPAVSSDARALVERGLQQAQAVGEWSRTIRALHLAVGLNPDNLNADALLGKVVALTTPQSSAPVVGDETLYRVQEYMLHNHGFLVAIQEYEKAAATPCSDESALTGRG